MFDRRMELGAVAVVWAAVAVLREVASWGGRVPVGMGTAAELAGLGTAFVLLVVSVARWAPRSTLRLLPAVCVLLGAGYLVASATWQPSVDDGMRRYASYHETWVATRDDPVPKGRWRGCVPETRESFRACLAGVSPSGREVVRDALAGAVVFGLALLAAPAVRRRSKVVARWPGAPQWGAAAVVVIAALAVRVGGDTRGQYNSLDLLVVSVQPGDAIRFLCLATMASALSPRAAALRLLAEQPSFWRKLPSVRHLVPVLGVPVLAFLVFGWNGDLGPALLLAFVVASLMWVATDHLRYVALALAFFALGTGLILVTPVLPERARERLGAVFVQEPPVNVAGTRVEDCPTERPASVSIPPESPRFTCYWGLEHVARTQAAVARGGWTGVGVGNGRAASSVPEVATDSAFSVVAEETGTVGVAVVLAALAVLCLECLGVARAAGGAPGLFSAGVGLHTLLQGFLIAGGLMGLAPLTGITFPFVSSGTSATLALLVALGVVMATSEAAATRGEWP